MLNPLRSFVGVVQPQAHYTLLNVPGLSKMSPWFKWRLASWAAAQGVSADCILAMIHTESGFNPKAINPGTGASGLIQVMPAYAKLYNASIEQIRAMTADEQLERIIMRKQWPKTKDCGVVYMANFLPAYTYAEADVVGDKSGAAGDIKGGLSTKSVYCANATKNPDGSCGWSHFDADKDGKFTAGDVKDFMRKRVEGWGKQYGYIEVPMAEPAKPGALSASSKGMLIVAGVALAAGAAVVVQRSRSMRSNPVDEQLIQRAAMLLGYMTPKEARRHLVAQGELAEDAYLAVRAAEVLTSEYSPQECC